jgi:hypothetical protein
MAAKLINKDEYRGCKISFFEQWNPHDYDGISYSYEIVDRQGNSRTDQTDKYPFDNLDFAKIKVTESIDQDLDKCYAISCLATNRNKHEHFALSFHGELDGAIEAGLRELTKLYPEWKHSVKLCELD